MRRQQHRILSMDSRLGGLRSFSSGASEAGFTLIEVLVALVLVVVGLLGLAILFPAEIRMSAQSKVSSGALMMAQRELDQVRKNIFAPSTLYSDADGNTLLDASCAGAAGTSCGNPLTADGLIDFSAASAVGYSVQLQDGSGQTYSVRWNVMVTANDGRRIILGSKALNPPAGVPGVVHLQTLVAR
jgi:type IV pilus modification protein PilV